MNEKKEEERKKNKNKDDSDDENESTGTFNDLDKRFQLSPEHDPNHVFPEEMEMVRQMRDELSKDFRAEIEAATDKFLLTFLFARRHKVKESVELLKYRTIF